MVTGRRLPAERPVLPAPAHSLAAHELETLRAGLRLLALRSLRDAELADEAAQETLARALTALRDGQVHNPAHLGAFVRGIARHVITDLHRARQRTTPLDASAEATDPPAPDPDALHTLVSAEENQRVRQALDELSPDDREILRLSFFEGLTPAELAEAQGHRRGNRMINGRLVMVAAQVVALAAGAGAAWAQGTPPLPKRAVRRDIPLTNAIRRAFQAGTRDSTGRPGRNYWQLKTDYTISARLDPATSRITGRESVLIHNTSPDSLITIVLRLDPNIFLGNVPRAAPWIPAENTDGMVISRMTLNGQPVNLAAQPPRGPRGEPVPPTELGALGLNSTVARLLLPDPIPRRSTATLEIDWSFKLPGGPGQGHRMTMRWGDTLYQPTQWYPRVAVYDDLRGWDTELYLGPSEFYNNFGRFDVKIDVPAGWIVSGTGVLQNPEQVLTPRARDQLARVLESDEIRTIVAPDEVGPGNATAAGDRLVWHFVADTVNDFAWATAKKYVWQATRATIPEKGPVPIHMVFLPERARLYANAGPVTRHALEFYSKLWFPYEFPQLTLQDGPSSGMEYPMVINSNQGAADHETGHQWWPMIVGNNETWYGWMDEGFNQYMNILSAADTRRQPANLDGYGQFYGGISGTESEPPMMWNANYAGPMYGFQTYSKTPLMLSMLGGIVGDSAVQRAHAEWGRAWLFKHPSPWDYMFFMSNALKRDLGWFWYYWLFTTESVDGSIQGVRTEGPRTTVVVRQDGQMPSPVVLKVRFATTGPPIRTMPDATMLDATTALVTYPVDVWFSGNRTFEAVLDFGGRAIERISIDPYCRFPDRDLSDNVWPREAPPPQRQPGACHG